MSEWIRFTAIDPALRNWGLALFQYNITTRELHLLDMRLVQTEDQSGKTVRKNSSDLACANELFQASMDWMRDSSLFAAEIPSGTQSARGAMSNGICLGVLASLQSHRPLIQVSIAEAKKVATGRKTGSKEEMIAYAMKRFPAAPWLLRKLKGEMVPINDNEHLADACCIGIAATTTQEFLTAARIVSATRMQKAA